MPDTVISPLCSFALVLKLVRIREIYANSLSYSRLDQSKPAGHIKAPVRSCRNPRSVLTLLASGGVKGWPLGVIQSRIGPLRLFVSSARAPETPFCILKQFRNLMILQTISVDDMTHQLSNMLDVIVRGILQPTFEMWYVLKQGQKYPTFGRVA